MPAARPPYSRGQAARRPTGVGQGPVPPPQYLEVVARRCHAALARLRSRPASGSPPARTASSARNPVHRVAVRLHGRSSYPVGPGASTAVLGGGLRWYCAVPTMQSQQCSPNTAVPIAQSQHHSPSNTQSQTPSPNTTDPPTPRAQLGTPGPMVGIGWPLVRGRRGATMPDAVIVSACRTAIGTARKGTLSETEASVLAQPVIEESLTRTGLAAGDIDDLILAESLYGGGVVARYVAVVAGMESVPGLAHNRHCASGLAAVQSASASIMAGMDNAVIAGGVQASSSSPRDKRRVPGSDDWEDWMSLSHPSTPEAPALDMSITVGWNTARRSERPERNGRLGPPLPPAGHRRHRRGPLRPRDRAHQGHHQGRLGRGVRDRRAPPAGLDRREAGLAQAHPPRDRGLLHHRRQRLGRERRRLGPRGHLGRFCRRPRSDPLATVRSWASVGVDPKDTGMAPTIAIPKALDGPG